MSIRQGNDTKAEDKGQARLPEPHPKNGHIRLPNEVVENLARLEANGSQYRIIFAIWRRTLGWQKSGEWKNEPYPISLGDLAKATGLDRRQIIREVKDLTERNVLRRDPGSRKSLISFNLDYTSWVVVKLPLPSEQHLVVKLPPPSGETTTRPSGETTTTLVVKLPPARPVKKPKETINKHTKETGAVSAPPIKTATKSKPYQVEAGTFLDLVEQREDTKIINRGKAIKAVRAIFNKYPETTPDKLYQCFAWLRDNDSFLYNKEPPMIISFMPDKFPAWLAGKLKGIGDEPYGHQPRKSARPKPDQERLHPVKRIDGETGEQR